MSFYEPVCAKFEFVAHYHNHTFGLKWMKLKWMKLN